MQVTPIYTQTQAQLTLPIAVDRQSPERTPVGAYIRLMARRLGVLFCLPFLPSAALAATSNVDVYGIFYTGMESSFTSTLFESGLSAAYAGLAAPNLVLNGAHHRTLLALKDTSGSGCTWGTVDFSQTNNAAVYLGEVGACKDIGAGRVGVGFGGTESAVERRLAGKSTSTGKYLIAEWATPIGRNLEVSVTGVYGAFETDHRRNYPNGLVVDSSSGQVDARSSAWRLRLDWGDATTIGGQSISPYVAYSRSETKQEAYSETGGGSPVSFAAQNWRGRALRIGATTRMTLSADTELHMAVAVNHVFGEDSVEVTGSGFNLLGKLSANNGIGISLDIDKRLTPHATWSTGMGLTSSFDSGNADVWAITTGIRANF